MGSRLEKKSAEVRKRLEGHTFDNEDGDEYNASSFGGFPAYFARKKQKLLNLDAEKRAHSDKPNIFRGIVAHVNGYTQPSLNDLHDLVVAHGGGFLQYLDGKTMVTHIIASSLTPKKVVEFRRYRIVKPAWVVDSVKAGKLLSWNEYRVVDEGAGQKLLGFDSGQLSTQISTRVKGYREQSNTSWYNSQLRGQDSITEPDTGLNARLAVHDPAPERTTSSDSLPNISSVPSGTPTSVVQTQHSTLDGDVSFSLSDVVRLEQSADAQRAPKKHADRCSTVIDDEEALLALALSSPISSEVLSEVEGDNDYVSKTDEDQSLIKRSPTLETDTPCNVTRLTAEEHNTVLLSDPRIRKSTVVNPEFLEQYYRESRLHHLSTWKADLKAQLQAMTAEQSSSQKAKARRPLGSRRYIMHVDFDSFFVAVSLKKCPHLKDKPVVVAHGGGSGSEIASCNYPARAFGVKNGMWMRTAQVKCPDLVVLPYDFPGYEEASRNFYDAILATGGIVQSVSVDEALVDVSAECIAASGTDGLGQGETAVSREQAKADELARALRDKVLQVTACNVSVGIASNILLAKVALRKAKPAGQYQLKPDAVLDFIGELEVQDLPGVASSLGSKLEDIGIKFVKDIRECTRERLIGTLGPKTGEKLWDYARGIDRTEVGDQVVRKSVSAEVNWGVRFENQAQVDVFIKSLCGELQKRLAKERVKGRQLTVKIMRRSPEAALDPPKFLGHGKCDVYNKSVQLGVATNDAAIFVKDVFGIMRTFSFTPGEYRGIGLQITKLEPVKSDGSDSSQRRLQFKSGVPAGPVKRELEQMDDDPIQDIVQTPKKKQPRLQDLVPPSLLAHAGDNSPTRRPLNLAGTQFALPTQADPAVLAELPDDIRARLFPHSRTEAASARAVDKSIVPVTRSRSPLLDMPSRSQLDDETLAALPEDLRAEVLALYGSKSEEKFNSPGKRIIGQTVLPQSPRKNRTLPPNKAIGPSKRARSLFATKRGARANNDSTLTQSNFVARAGTTTEGASDANASESEAAADMNAEFLAALPEEVRAELIEQHRQERLRRAGGIDLSLHQRSRARRQIRSGHHNQQPNESFERLFKLAPRAPKPTFSKLKLSEIEDLRGMIKDWVAEFRDEEPFADDVKALTAYLTAVVTQEKDLAKAVRVVKWLSWTVERESEKYWQGDEMRTRWESVLDTVKGSVQDAVRSRGLGARGTVLSAHLPSQVAHDEFA